MFPPAVLAWEAFWKVTLIAPWVASEASNVNGEELTSVRDAIRSSPVHPHPVLVVELGGMRMAPASVRDRLSDQEGKTFGVNV